MRVATRGHGGFPAEMGAEAGRERDPDSGPDGERQVGAGRPAGARNRRRGRQCQFHAGLWCPQPSDRAAAGGGARSRARIISMAMSRRRRAIRPGTWLRDVGATFRRQCAGGPPARLRRRHRPLFPGAAGRPVADARRARCGEGAMARTARGGRGRGVAPPSWRARPCHGRAARAHRRATHRSRTRGARRVGALDHRVAGGKGDAARRPANGRAHRARCRSRRDSRGAFPCVSTG